MDAFLRCNEAFDTQQYSLPYDTPWHDSDLEETRALMGEDWHPYGIEKNRRALEAFCAQAHESGLVSRRIGLEGINDAFRSMEAGEVARSVVDYGL